MKLRQAFRTLVIAMALVAILLASTGAGEACEAWQHRNCNSCDTCQICHVGHQAMQAAAAAHSLAVLEPLDLLSVTPVVQFVPVSFTSLLGTRAPPVTTLS